MTCPARPSSALSSPTELGMMVSGLCGRTKPGGSLPAEHNWGPTVEDAVVT